MFDVRFTSETELSEEEIDRRELNPEQFPRWGDIILVEGKSYRVQYTVWDFNAVSATIVTSEIIGGSW